MAILEDFNKIVICTIQLYTTEPNLAEKVMNASRFDSMCCE